MAGSNGRVEPDERSPLLAKDSTKNLPDASLGALPGGPVENEGTNGIADADEAQVPPADDTLRKGIPKMAANMRWLLPAVGIGVRCFSQYHCHVLRV